MTSKRPPTPNTNPTVVSSPGGAVPASPERVTVSGRRLTLGNAVECPTIQGDDGQVYAVSHLAAALQIGDRVTVTGYVGNVTHCRGRVIVVESAS